MNKQFIPESFYEIELKSLLDKEIYKFIKEKFAADQKFKHHNTERIETSFFKDDLKNDIRLRISDKTCELVYKKGLVNEFVRKEIKIPLAHSQKLEYLDEIFHNLEVRPERGTIKHKFEYLYNYNGYDYVVCLQYLEDFAYILEIEYLAKNETEAELHVPNIKNIFQELNLQIINGEKFMERVYRYINGDNTINDPL